MMALDLKEKISCIWHFAIPVFHPKPPKWQHFVKDSEYQQAMHLYIQMRKPGISIVPEMPGFCLLRRCPNPRRTQICVLETLQEMQQLRDFAIAETER